jgi:phosphinothricin acetyltransferase
LPDDPDRALMAGTPVAGTAVSVRAGDAEDLDELTRIYNSYVLHSSCTFDLSPVSAEERGRWLAQYGVTGPHRLLVGEQGGRILGYTTSSRFRPKPGYAASVETTVYCAPGATGRGVGTCLYDRLFAELAVAGVHRAFAAVTLPNEASIRLHRRFGFRDVGVLHQAGRKFGRFWDVLWLEAAVG